MNNQHKLIEGYRDLSWDEIKAINDLKQGEIGLAELLAKLEAELNADPRQMTLARTHFEEAFMHAIKSIAKPECPWNVKGR